MKLLTLDFESFYSQEYSLSSMNTEEYIRDPRFQTILVSLQMGENPPTWVPRPRIPEVFARLPWDELAVLAHHAHFDLAILHWIYGIKPKFICDTLSMAHALFPTDQHDLNSLATILGLPPKGEEVKKFKGYRYEDFTPEELTIYGSYSMNDTRITKGAFDIMKKRFTPDELTLIDHTIRMFTEPKVFFNKRILQKAYEYERKQLLEVFCKAMPELASEAEKAIIQEDQTAWKLLKTPLSSNNQFAKILFDLGIDPPKKLSPTAVKKGTADPSVDFEAPEGMLPKGEKKWAYAFSKKDENFLVYMDHPDPKIAALAEARVNVKSTIRETRAKRYIGMADRGPVPIYLKYFGAHTSRFSAGDKTNFANLTQLCSACNGEGCELCEGTKISSLRRAITAPPGHLIVVRDLSAIEARKNAWLSGQTNIVSAFRQGKDVYCEMASIIFGRTITDTPANKKERFLGKTVILGCGYSMWWKKFAMMLRAGMLGAKGVTLGQDIANALGVSADGFLAKEAEWLYNTCPQKLTIEEWALHCACAARIIYLYRSNNKAIVDFWETCQQILGVIYRNERAYFGTDDCLYADKDGIWLPNKTLIHYSGLKYTMRGKRVEYSVLKDKRSFERGRVYGGLVTENVVQGLSRVHLTTGILQMIREGIQVVHHVYDEVVAIARIDEAQQVYDRMGEILQTPPEWGKGIPLASKGGFAENYIK